MLHSPDDLRCKEWSSFIFLRQHSSNNRRENQKLTACIRCPSPLSETRRHALQSSPSLLRISDSSTGEDPSLQGLTPYRPTIRYRRQVGTSCFHPYCSSRSIFSLQMDASPKESRRPVITEHWNFITTAWRTSNLVILMCIQQSTFFIVFLTLSSLMLF